MVALTLPSACVRSGELALCLLSEIAYELDKDFEPHLAVLLHAAVSGCLQYVGLHDAYTLMTMSLPLKDISVMMHLTCLRADTTP